MRKALQGLGFVLVLAGISGAIDRLAYQPIMGFLNVVNRLVIPRVGFLDGYEVFANLSVALCGAVVIVAATRMRTSSGT